MLKDFLLYLKIKKLLKGLTMKTILKNWKTSLAGILAALGTSGVIPNPAINDILNAVGLLLLGASAKDGDKTGL